MKRKDVLTAISADARTALRGAGGVREQEALAVLRASFEATEGGFFAKLRAAQLMMRWRQRYAGGQ